MRTPAHRTHGARWCDVPHGTAQQQETKNKLCEDVSFFTFQFYCVYRPILHGGTSHISDISYLKLNITALRDRVSCMQLHSHFNQDRK